MRNLAVFAFVFAAAVSVRAGNDLDIEALVRNADKLTLYSIVPEELYRQDELDEHDQPTAEARKRHLHDYPVLGRLTPDDNVTKNIIRNSVLAAMRDVPDGDRAPLMCFFPRHAVRLQKGDRQVDLLLCFQCLEGRAYFFAAGKEQEQSFTVGAAGRDALNQLLDSQKIPRDLPPKQKKPK